MEHYDDSRSGKPVEGSQPFRPKPPKVLRKEVVRL